MSTPNGWQEPKQNWKSGDPVGQADFNRIEGNINAIENGERTLDPSQAPTSNTGTLRQLLNWIANRIKAILGTTNWWDNPSATLKDLGDHIGAGGDAHMEATSNNAGFMSSYDAEKLSKIHTTIVTQDGFGADGDYIEFGEEIIDPIVKLEPIRLSVYDPSRSSLEQAIEVQAVNVSSEGFIGRCRLLVLGSQTKHTINYTMDKNALPKEWVFGGTTNPNTRKIILDLEMHVAGGAYAFKDYRIRIRWEVWVRKSGEPNWTKLDENTISYRYSNTGFTWNDFKVTRTKQSSYDLEADQYEVKVIYKAIEVDWPNNGGYNTCNLTVKALTENSDTVIKSGQFKYSVIGEKHLMGQGD